MKNKCSSTLFWLLIFYIGTYAGFYINSSPAANLMYFVYLKGGAKVEACETGLYYFYYPIYKAHRLFGCTRHNFDRPLPVESE
jgi:hypothetical protein